MELVVDNEWTEGNWTVRPWVVGTGAAVPLLNRKREGTVELQQDGSVGEAIAQTCMDALRIHGRGFPMVVDVKINGRWRARMRVLEDGRVVVRKSATGPRGGYPMEMRHPAYGILVRNDRRVPDLYIRNDMEDE